MNKEEIPPSVCVTRSGPWRQRAFAWALAHLNQKYERFVQKYKRQLFADLSGIVLEIGPGTGANLRYFPREGIRWIGIEPNPFMSQYLEEEGARLGMKIELRSGTADHLPVPDGSVDAVVSTLVLCCVGDQQLTLREVMRVLKPGGKFVFIEHVAAPIGTRLRRFQNWVTPLWRRMGDGCHPNRETWIELENAGFDKLTYEKFKAPAPIVSPQIFGVAVKSSLPIPQRGYVIARPKTVRARCACGDATAHEEEAPPSTSSESQTL